MADPLMVEESTAPLAPVESPDPGVRGDAAGVDSLTVQHVLGLYLPDGPQRTQLQAVQEYLNKTATGPSSAEIRAAIYRLEKRFGQPKLGETRLGRLYNYIKLSQKITDLEQARQEYLT